MSIDDVLKEYKTDTDAVVAFSEELYQPFKEDFAMVDKMYDKMNETPSKVTDDELEEIMTALPLKIIHVSSGLSQIQLRKEVVKLKNKDKKQSIREEIEEKYEDYLAPMSKTEQKAFVDAKVEQELTAYNILLTAYDSVINRLNTEISFSRELIMSCKKVWDARRAAEAPMISNPKDRNQSSPNNIPDYRPNQKVY